MIGLLAQQKNVNSETEIQSKGSPQWGHGVPGTNTPILKPQAGQIEPTSSYDILTANGSSIFNDAIDWIPITTHILICRILLCCPCPLKR